MIHKARLFDIADERSIRFGISCDFCGFPFDGDDVVRYVDDDDESVFCSNQCAIDYERRSAHDATA